MSALKKLAFFLLLCSTLSLQAQTFSSQIEQPILSSENDAFEIGIGLGEMNLNSFGYTMVETFAKNHYGFRFENLTIPQGATITEAYIQFTCRDADGSDGPANIEIRGELSTNPGIFLENDKNITNRPNTASTVSWEPGAWRWKEYAGLDERTSNIAAIFEEIVGQAEWQPGNPAVIILTGSGARAVHNFDSDKPAVLTIKYEATNPTESIANIYLNEIAPNGTDYLDDTGDFEDWIELYNDNDFAVNLGGLFLSDNVNKLDKWQIATPEEIPAKGFATIWADNAPHKGGLHAKYSLNKNGETIILSQLIGDDLTIIDSFTYAEVPFKGSTGRVNESSADWVIFGTPTPKAANASGLSWLAPPVIELEEGIYANEQMITISHPDPTTTILYTLDNSDPNQFAIPYTGPISLTSTKTLKARAFKTGLATSQIAIKSYLFDPANELPVLMISADPKNLFGDEAGIYVSGNGGDPIFICGEYQNQNYNQDWERPAHLTLFENNGDLAFSVNAGIRIAGSCSRKYALKTLNVYLRNNQYGHKDIDYQLFPDREFENYSRFKIRNSGQDYRGCMMRDGVNQSIIGQGIDLEYQAYRPTVVFINGEYWGMANFRELYGKDYFEDFHEVDGNEIDIIKNAEFNRNVKQGDDIHFQELYNYVLDNGLTETAHFDYFSSQVDINSFIDYWVTMLYISNTDWPANNKQIWRPRKSDGKWRWMLIDTDGSTNLSGATSDQGHLSDKLSQILPDNIVGWPNDSRSSLFIREALKNLFFESEFLQRACTHMELTYHPEVVLPKFDEYQAAIDADIEAHISRWAFDNPDLTDKGDWEDNANKFRTFYQERPPYFYGNLMNNLSPIDTFQLHFNFDENSNGRVVIHWNEMEIPYNYTGTYFKSTQIRMKAIPDPGYEFVRWEESGITSTQTDLSSNVDSMTRTPIFELIVSSDEQLSNRQLKLWPNPAHESIVIELGDNQQGTIHVFEMGSGKKVLSRTQSEPQSQIDISGLNTGVYLVQYEDLDGNKRMGKFVKI